MKYYKGLDFKKLKAGILITDIPINHPIFQEHEGYIAIRRHKRKWIDRIAELHEYFENKELPPSYYCLNCNRLEDGSHRFDLAKNYLKLKLRNVRIGSVCYKKLKANIYTMFENRMYKMGVAQKDFQWLKAAENTKWNHFNKLDYYKKNVLDVGCQTGYLLFKALTRGAKKAVGYDTRENVLKVGKQLGNLLKLKKKLSLYNKDFRKADIKPNKFDIVLCLGLLHYFDKSEYESVWDKLLSICKEKLIIEVRCTNSEKKALISRKQTITTMGWVKNWALHNSVDIMKQINRDKDRWLFIFDVKNKPKPIKEPLPHNQTIVEFEYNEKNMTEEQAKNLLLGKIPKDLESE